MGLPQRAARRSPPREQDRAQPVAVLGRCQELRLWQNYSLGDQRDLRHNPTQAPSLPRPTGHAFHQMNGFPGVPWTHSVQEIYTDT